MPIVPYINHSRDIASVLSSFNDNSGNTYKPGAHGNGTIAGGTAPTSSNNGAFNNFIKSIYDTLSGPAHQQALDAMQAEAQINQSLADYANSFAKEERIAAQEFNKYMAEYANAFSASEAEKARKFSAEQAEITRAFNKAEAELNRQFQLNMSNTAYQRAVADMKAAGLNPYLAYSQGGSAMASGTAASATVPGSYSAVGLSATSHGASASKAAASYKTRSDLISQLVGNIASSAYKVAAFT